MGLYDRDYMRAKRPPAGPQQPPRPALWKRLLFKLWLLLHPRRRGRRA